jgi:gamma-glutamyltranspeptidase/glutathione hydrolase
VIRTTRHLGCIIDPVTKRFLLSLALAALVACGETPQPVVPPVVVAAPVSAPSASAVVVREAPPPEVEPWPYVTPNVVRSPHGMIVTDNALGTKVGRDILAAGGNAVDAAVATAFALAVTYPTAGNIGGGGFAVIRMHGQPYALDFRETAPASASRDMFVDADGKAKPDAREGIKSVGVPGSVAGLWALHQKLGSKKMTWAALLAPAIALAEQGFPVDADFVDAKMASKRLSKYPGSAALFLPGGQPPAAGSVWKNPELAAVLRRIVAGGPKGFYEGPTAAAIVAEMKADGGLVTQADLHAYQAKWRTPLEFTYRGHHLTTMPPPSSGGVTLAMMCHILEGFDFTHETFQDPTELHDLFEAMRRAFAARNAKLGDPDFVKMPLDRLLSTAWATEERASIQADRATPSSSLATEGGMSGAGPHTTNFSVVDGEGNAVALTTTINWWFGSGVTVRGAGFVLNNEMDDFAAVPGTANGFGLVQGEANAIAPKKRMLSSMSPTIVTDPAGRVALVLGAAGGPTIITSVLQELSAVIDFHQSIGAATYAPRFHMQHLPDEVAFEKAGLAPATAEALRAMGYTMKERGHLADAPAIGRDGDDWLGVAEPRRRGGLAEAP